VSGSGPGHPAVGRLEHMGLSAPRAKMPTRERSAHERVRRRSALPEAPLRARAVVGTAAGGNEGVVHAEGL